MERLALRSRRGRVNFKKAIVEKLSEMLCDNCAGWEKLTKFSYNDGNPSDTSEHYVYLCEDCFEEEE